MLARNSRIVVAVVSVALGSLAACASDGDTVSAADSRPDAVAAPPSSTASSSRSPQTEDAAWDAYKQQQGGEIELESESDGHGRGTRRLLARTDAQERIVDVAEFDGQQWTTVGEIVLPPPEFTFGGGRRTIQFGDVTSDGTTDYLVPLDASQDIGVVISNDGGAWRALLVRGSDGAANDPYLGIEPRYDSGQLVSEGNSCQPTCAEGDELVISWRYEEGELVNNLE